jgi:hypothetical protein
MTAFRNTSRRILPIGKGTGSTGDPHFALGTAVESPESAIRRTRTCNEWPDGESSSRNAQRTYVCNTPILNSRVAGACDAASIPIDIHVLVSNGSIIASSHSLAAS